MVVKLRACPFPHASIVSLAPILSAGRRSAQRLISAGSRGEDRKTLTA